jgi:hypothetical protein
VLGLGQIWCIWKACIVFFPTRLIFTLQSSAQETTALRSKALNLVSVTSSVFPNFQVKILVGFEMLSVNWDNKVVDNLVIFEKVLAFWITLVWILKILCTKMVHWTAVVGEFPTFELVFTVFLAFG